MKVFKYGFDPVELKMNPDEQKFIEAAGLKIVFENILNNAFQVRYPQGIGGSVQRTYGRILTKLDVQEYDQVNLEEGEFDLLKNLFTHEGARFHPSQTRLILKYIQEIEKLQTEK